MSDIEKIHIRAARFVKRVGKKVPDIEVLDTAHWKKIQYYYKRTLACTTYKIYNNLTSPVLQKYVTKSKTTRNTQNKYRIDLPTFKYIAYKRSFEYRAAIIWNNIPTELKEASSIDVFKYSISKNNLLDKINFGTNATGRAKDLNFIYY